jgi:DNA-binding GntR family transcriptional regulator
MLHILSGATVRLIVFFDRSVRTPRTVSTVETSTDTVKMCRGIVTKRSQGRIRVTTPEQMAGILRQAIREKVLPPGELLVQEDLAHRFAVSRNPVREALKILSAEGLVEIGSGGRAAVRTLTIDDLNEIYDLRIALEPTLAPRIVDEARGRDVAQLREAIREMAAQDSVSDWLRLNYDFHLRLYKLADRPHTELILTNLLSLTQPYSQENVGALGGRSSASAEHVQMVDAIESRDAVKLAELLEVHLESARDRLRAAWATVGAPSDDVLSALRGPRA